MKFIFFWFLSLTLLFSQNLGVQVVALQKHKPDPLLLFKIEQFRFQYRDIKEAPFEHKIILGPFSNHKSCQKALEIARCTIASDAFVRQFPKVKHQNSVSQKSKTAQKIPVQTQDLSFTAASTRTDIPKDSGNCPCRAKRKQLKERQMQQILNFYKSSADYRFKKPSNWFEGS